MKQANFPSTSLIAAGAALAMSLASMPAIGAEAEWYQTSTPGLVSGVSSTAATATGSGGATVITRSGRGEQVSNEDCRVVEMQPSDGKASSGANEGAPSGTGESSASTRSSDDGGLSSTVRIPGQNGLSSTTRVPGGSSVTVHSGGPGSSSSSSSAASSSSSSGGNQSSVTTGTGQGDDCVIYVNPGESETHIERSRKP